MSRIGKKPIPLPAGVQISVTEDNYVTVKGPLGQLEQQMPKDIKINIEDGQALVTRPSDAKEHRSLHGLTRSLLANMVEGVTKGYVRNLEIVGVGYRAALQGKDINLTVGYSHPVVISPPKGVEFEVPAPNKISVKGIDKQVVGQIAAEIRAVRKPEPYLGKGIRYEGEQVRRIVGKAGK
ncbi:MAG: 50S ribosomal protein L6 [Firmicutes bacterium]|jgi:large subunit ribosomal protein L6|nr:50S ribosomal protein L6 [Bacillota bacterium]